MLESFDVALLFDDFSGREKCFILVQDVSWLNKSVDFLVIEFFFSKKCLQTVATRQHCIDYNTTSARLSKPHLQPKCLESYKKKHPRETSVPAV